MREGSGVSSQLWERLLSLNNLEEELENHPRRESLVACLSRCPDNFHALIVRCLETVETELAKKADDVDEAAETVLANALFVMSYLLAALPAAPTGLKNSGDDAEVTKNDSSALLLKLELPLQKAACKAASASFVERLWYKTHHTKHGHWESASLTLRCWFHDGFTVEEPDVSEAEDVPDVNGVVPALIWQEGVGPEGSSQPKNSDMQANRVVGLQLLLALLAAGAPSAVDIQDTKGDDGSTVDARLSRLLIPDARPLAYLCDPSRTVPFRAELFYSLMSVALGYDPHGFGLPYGGYFAGAKQEAFAHLCIQALGLLLQDVRDAALCKGDMSILPSVAVRRPQELLISQRSIPEEEGASAQNVFRDMLAAIGSQGEVEFIVEGIVTLLGTVGKGKGSYLPSSMRLPPFLPELLVIVLHLTACPKFVAGACVEGEIISVIEGVLLAANQAPEHVDEHALSLVEAAILLNLTSYREVCVELDEDFDGSLPESMPDFEGTAADFVALAALAQANENLAKCKVSKVHENIVQMSLFTLANVSTFADGLCIETTSRLFSLFERCVKSLQLSRERLGFASHLPILLEAFDNVLQYRYGSNANLAYGLMTRQAIFRDLVSMVPQIQCNIDLEKDGNSGKDTQRWQQHVEVHLHPIATLLDATVPMLEAEVEKQEISNSDEAKELLPRCVLGLMPPPHAFQMRHLQRCAATHLACEHVLAACLGDGPVCPLWEVEDGKLGPQNNQCFKIAQQYLSAVRPEPRKGRERSNSRTRSASSSRSKGGAKAAASEPSKPGGKSPKNSPTAPDASEPGDSAVPNGSSQAEASVPEQGNEASPSSPQPAGMDALASQLQEAVASGVDVAQLLAQLQAAKVMRRSQWRLHLLSVASEADLPRTSEMHGSQKTELTGAVDERKYTEEQEVRQMQRWLTDLKGKLSAVQAAAAKIGAVARGSATRWKAWPCFGERREVSAAVLLHTLLLCDSVKVKQDYHEARAAVEADVIWAVGDPLEPPLLGFADYAQRNDSMPSVPDSIRFKVRDVTKQNVLKQLGQKEDLNYWSTFETLASRLLQEVSGTSGASLPPGPKKQMSMAHLFNDEETFAETSAEAAEGFVARRQDHYLLGKYQMVAVPAMADYDSAFGEVLRPQDLKNGLSQQTALDCDGPKGFDGWFWVLHAAAPNIGESAQADDFLAYSVDEEDDSSSPMRTESARSTASTASRCCWKERLLRPTRRLNEDLYIKDLRRLWRNVLIAMKHLKVEDVILFPFGMGAFLRHLHLNDDRYEDASSMRRLKRRIADELMNAIVDICLPRSKPVKAAKPAETRTRVHLCLVCVNRESVDNHNCFVQAAADRAKSCPELKEILHLRRNVDSLQLAHELAAGSGKSRPLKVALLNGANRKLCGNHWFQSGARYAIDENLHRRSASLSRASLLVNFDTEPRPRKAMQLQETVRFFRGTVVNLDKGTKSQQAPNPDKTLVDNAVVRSQKESKEPKQSAQVPAQGKGRKRFCLCGKTKAPLKADDDAEILATV
ncbi:Hid1 [Symbiodinium pilosum]|uniref:Hid1 protein n=1 Tax=Symbiodinium pilosum TaxID=2952 RepID=A0A812XRJ3_SYMPI|nr:Hid1 [Symbiodinium pilosum]